MRALSQEELEQMLQNDFLMASSCDAEQVVQVVEELMAREGSRKQYGGPGHRQSLEAFGNAMKESGRGGNNAPTTAEEKGMDGGQRFWRRCWPLRFCLRRGTRGCSRSTAHGRRRTARR